MNILVETIDIIVPIYNMEDRLEQCLQSLLKQKVTSLFTYRILLVNDGSTDDTQVICTNYANKYPEKILSFIKSNGGVSSARNFGLQKANADYITFVDPDDYVLPTYLLNLFTTLKKTGADISSSCFKETWNNDRNQSLSETKLKNLQILSAKEALRKLFYQDGLEFAVWGKLIKRALFFNVSFPEGKRYEDVPVTYNLISKCTKVAVIENKDYVYWQREDGMLNSKFNLSKLDVVPVMDNLYETVLRDYPQLKSAVACRYFAGMSNVYFQIPNDVKQKAKIWNAMKSKRKLALLDRNASKKVRLGALSMYMGRHLMEYLYIKTQKRGKLLHKK